MKKSLLSILLFAFLAFFAGCAEDNVKTADNSTEIGDGTGTGGVTGTGNNTSNIPVENESNPFQLIKAGNYASGNISFTNPRTEPGSYYPILLDNVMGKGEYAPTLSSDLSTDTGNLAIGQQGYDLKSATPLGDGVQYRLAIETLSGNIPNEGTIIIAFLTKEEENKFFNVDQLTQSVIDDLNKLGALRQYKWEAK